MDRGRDGAVASHRGPKCRGKGGIRQRAAKMRQKRDVEMGQRVSPGKMERAMGIEPT